MRDGGLSVSEGNGDARKVCYLGMPCHGAPEMAAARGLFRAASGKGGLKVQASFLSGSLLNANCNGLVAWACNAQRVQGRRVDYFGVLHADVCPHEDFWLEALIAELERSGLDLLSVAVPVKDGRGLVSTALGHPGPQDYTRAFCRLSLAELYKLPETFTAADLGHPDRPLLVNTGCFVCKFDWRWAEKVVFQDVNRLIWDDELGQYRVETFPEDWNFARQCVALGLKVGCTRKVLVEHRGPQSFSNAGPWGDFEFDREYLDGPAVKVPEEPPGGWQFPHEVGGWLTETEGRILAEVAEGKRVLEVGSYLGRSTICLAQKAKSVDCVDPFDGRATPEPKPCREKFAENLRRHNQAHKITAHVGTFSDVAPHLWAGFDFIFIDGDHRYESVKADIENALRLLKPGGVLAFHDYDRPGDEGVTQAVDELIGGGAKLFARVDHVAFVRPAAAAEPELVGV